MKRAENWIAFNKWRLMLTCKPRTSHATFAYRFLEEIIMAFFAVWHRVLMAAIIDTREYLFSRNIAKYPSMIAPLNKNVLRTDYIGRSKEMLR